MRRAFALLGPYFLALAFYSAPTHAANEQVWVTQSTNGHVIGHVSSDLRAGCATVPLNVNHFPPSTAYLATTDLYACGLDATPAPYAGSADLGVLGDADYVFGWTYIEDGFGPVGTVTSRHFSIRAGVLLPDAVVGNPIPTLSLPALVTLSVLAALLGVVAYPRRRV